MAATAGPIEPWGRGRLRAAAAGLVVAAVLLTFGLAVGLTRLIHPHPTPAAPLAARPAAAPPGVGVSRDAIAAAPMPLIAPDQGRPGARPALTRPALVEVPAASSTGPAGVASGFPRTPVGAIGQLAALLGAVIEAMDVEHTAQVYAGWSAPDAPPVQQWPAMGAVRAFLASARLSRLGPGDVVVVTPVGAQVKGVDGPDWTLACVLVTVRARVNGEARIAYGHCERMTWQSTRWVIGPGAFPAPAPHTWPGSEAMLTAGWRSWSEGHPR